MIRGLAPAVAFACAVAWPATASAEWQPPDLRPAHGTLAEVMRLNAEATGTPEARYAQRRERWTYRNEGRQLPVRVAVRGADFRATVVLGNAEYAGGRSDGVRWRADANGVTHATLSDDQGDAIDRLPQSIFPFAWSECTLAGESTRFGAAWLVVDRPPRDKPHWFYVDKTSGVIAREMTREGKRTIVTTFSGFEAVAGTRRPSRWHVADGDASHDLDVAVDDVAPEAIADVEVAIPQTKRLFAAPLPPSSGIVQLPASFAGGRISVNVALGKRRAIFVLDTGTASITLDRRLAQTLPSEIVLEHATVPAMTVGTLTLNDVSALAIPVGVDGILGYDFFLGHVVHIDYGNARVEVMTQEAAEAAFTDPRNTVMSAYFDEGIPLVHAAFGSAFGDRFALDTGSPNLFVFAPFARRYGHEIDAYWSLSAFGSAEGRRTDEEEHYLEGSIRVRAHKVSLFRLGPLAFRDIIVGVEVPNDSPDAIDIPIDGIIGTDEMRFFDWWFDYDGGRIALRRNNR